MTIDAQDDTLRPHELRFILKLVGERSGVVLEEEKIYLVNSRLGQLSRTLNIQSVPLLIRQMMAHRDSEIERQVVEAMVTNETFFFRDIKPFKALEKDIFPTLFAQRASSDSINIWSAACSTGQEPYSIALLVRSKFPQKVWPRIHIIGTDLSQSALDIAKTGRYSQVEVNRGLPAHMLVRNFTRRGNDWTLNEDIRAMVSFRLLNLLQSWPRFPKMDIILLRNLLIYFDRPTRTRLLKKIVTQLKPDGYVLLGSSEAVQDDSIGLTHHFVRGVNFYRPALRSA